LSYVILLPKKKNFNQLKLKKYTVKTKASKDIEEKNPKEKKVKPIITNKPKSFSTFSIKEKLDQSSKSNIVEEPEPTKEGEELKENFNNDFTEKDLIDKWHQFSDKIGDKPRIFNTLTSKDPKLEENHVVSFLIDNNLQKEKINEIRNELLSFLKTELKNSTIDLKLVITDLEEENNKLYTSEDKFKHMLSKNKDLNKLKQEFNLDLE
jgi:DNA polymerase-3 subunit gamma/tau